MKAGRYAIALLIGGLILIIVAAVAGSFGSSRKSAAVDQASQTDDANRTVPWDYKVEQKKVGDLIGGDMTLLPEDELMPNDNNYATGDTVWVMTEMSAVITTQAGGKNEVTLTKWQPIKTFKQQDAADADMAKLKEDVKADIDLVGVYKTELDGKFREFAVVTLPTGFTVKQPIDEAHYQDFKTKKQVKANLEVVHDFSNYDQAFAKFRGWAS